MEDLVKKLEEIKKQYETHVANLRRLEQSRENCIATINAFGGKIQLLEELMKPVEAKEPDEKDGKK